jgi:hypothetical protein
VLAVHGSKTQGKMVFGHLKPSSQVFFPPISGYEETTELKVLWIYIGLEWSEDI